MKTNILESITPKLHGGHFHDSLMKYYTTYNKQHNVIQQGFIAHLEALRDLIDSTIEGDILDD